MVMVNNVAPKTDEERDYFTLVFGTDKPKKSEIAAALEKAHEIRQFEIRLYWQRNLFFWGGVLTFFGAYMLLLSKEDLTVYINVALLIIAVSLSGIAPMVR